MSDQRTIVIAITDSEHSMYAFNFYVDNVHKPGDRIVLVHVPEYSSVITDSSLFTDTQILSELLKVTEEKTQELIEKYVLRMEELRLNGYVKQQNGTTPGEAILEAVKEQGAVLLILGSKGRGFIRRTFLGSINSSALTISDKRTIVIAIEDSEHSMFAFSWKLCTYIYCNLKHSSLLTDPQILAELLKLMGEKTRELIEKYVLKKGGTTC